MLLSISFLKSNTGKNYKASKKTDKVFVHADDIKTHEQFFNFTKQFFFIQTRQISLRFDLFNAHAL